MSPSPRIISLIPSATEILYLLGLQDNIVGRSHDSNFPKEALKKKVVSKPTIGQNLNSLEIDKAVKNLAHHGTSVFHIDQKKLAKLEPDIIITQELCKVCAPSFDEVRSAAKILNGKVKIVSLEPQSINDLFENIKLIAEAAGVPDTARAPIERLKFRLDSIPPKHKNVRKPTVVIVEWLNPIMLAGHWVPEMVEIAGGKMLLSKLGEKSKYVDWYEVVNADPDVLILAPCGFDIERAKKEIYLFKYRTGWDKLRAVKTGRVFYMDGDAHLARSGPRLIDGIEILTKVLHPNWFGYPQLHEAQTVV